MKESDILYETGDGRLWICRNARGDFEVIENGMACARRRILIGQTYGLDHAIAAADKLLAEILAKEAEPVFRVVKRARPSRPRPEPVTPPDDRQIELF